MSTKLFPYAYVPPGFEIVIDLSSLAEQGIKGEIVPGSKGGIWNLWFNITLSDNPMTWDDEVQAINRMQGQLSEVTDDHRLIRAQMAEFCRDHPPFPLSIDVLCEEIGTGRFSKPVRLGCEGRTLLYTLGYDDPPSRGIQQKETLNAYANSLERWLAQSSPQNPSDSKVFGLLGQSNPRKQAFAEKLTSALQTEVPLISSITKVCHQECQQTRGQRFFEFPGRPAVCFNCLQQHPPEDRLPACCCSQVMDAALICTGTHEEDRTPYEYRFFREENILAYAAAINSWLQGLSPGELRWPDNTRHVTRENALLIGERVHSYLGENDKVKEWLAACLLKTVKDNQRWFQTTELVDGFPEATSWLKDMTSI